MAAIKDFRRSQLVLRRRQKGLRPFVENWQNVAARIIQRVHREPAANPSDERIKGFLEELLGAGQFAAARPRIAFPQNSGERVGSFRVTRVLRGQP
jgi:MmyB-like transcription regulator ligand binding domain